MRAIELSHMDQCAKRALVHMAQPKGGTQAAEGRRRGGMGAAFEQEGDLSAGIELRRETGQSINNNPPWDKTCRGSKPRL
jgi:hypothetical protein